MVKRLKEFCRLIVKAIGAIILAYRIEYAQR